MVICICDIKDDICGSQMVFCMVTSWNGNIFRVTAHLTMHKGQWRGVLMFYLIWDWMNDWVNNRDAGDLRRHCAHYDDRVMVDIVVNFYSLSPCGAIWRQRSGSVLQYIPRNMHTVFALLCFVVVIHWVIFPYPTGLLHWHCGNLTIAPVPAKQPWWIWINTSCEFIMNDCITTTKQSTTKPCAYFLGYTVAHLMGCLSH